MGDELALITKPFAYDPMDIDIELIKRASSKETSMCNYIWSCTWFFHERFWSLGYQQSRETTQNLTEWMMSNTYLPTNVKMLLKIKSQEDIERALCTYGLLANESWQPDVMISKDQQRAMDFCVFLRAAMAILEGVNDHGRLPPKNKVQAALDALPIFLQAQDLPKFQSGADQGLIYLPLEHSEGIMQGFNTHSQHITSSQQPSSSESMSGQPSFQGITPPPGGSSSTGNVQQEQQAAILALQQQVSLLTTQNQELQENIKHGSTSPVSKSQLREDQHEINLSLLQVIKQNQESKQKEKDPAEKILKRWELKILPSPVVKRVIKLNQFPTNSYVQKAIVISAQTLLQIYESYKQEIDFNDPYDPDALPTVITNQSMYYSLALSASEALKLIVGAHAFPKHEKPYLQERRNVLQAVLGGELTQAELKTAYQEEGGKGQGQGKKKSKKKKGNQNQSGKEQSQIPSGKQGRGRSPSPSRGDAPRSGSPKKDKP